MGEAVIVSAVRTPLGSSNGTLFNTNPRDVILPVIFPQHNG